MIISIIVYVALLIIVSIVSPLVLIYGSNKRFEDDARPYFAESEDLKAQIGEILEFKCLGRKSEGEKDGLPVCFEVRAEKGDCYVILWLDTVDYDSGEKEVTKYLITDSIPEDFF